MPQTRAHGAFIYCRYSTEHQHSIAEQVDTCTRTCHERSLPVLGIFPDEAVSGTKLSRANFDRMMADLRRGLADTVVIYDQSRLMRNVEGWFSTRNDLQTMGVSIISATQSHVGGDIRKSDVFMMESIQATYDQMHVLISREKSTAKLHFMARNGEHTGGVPALGYQVVEDADGKRRLAIAPEEAQTVRRIFEEYAQGKSYRLIIQGLNRDGIHTKRGQPFGTNSIHDLLKNRLYIGEKIYGARSYRLDGTRNTHAPEGKDVEVVPLPELAIVEKEIFMEVQAKMTANKHANAGRPAVTREYPLKGKVFCGECGAALAVATSRQKNAAAYTYYRCPRKNRTHDCAAKPIRCDELEKIVTDAVLSAIGNPGVCEKTIDRIRTFTASTGLDEKIAATTQQRTAAAQKLDNAINSLLDMGPLPALKEKVFTLQTDLTAIDTTLENLKAQKAAQITPAQIEALYRKLCKAALKTPTAILSIVSRVDVYDDKINIFTIFSPTGKPTEKDFKESDFIKIEGTPSGVPMILINPLGLLIKTQRIARK